MNDPIEQQNVESEIAPGIVPWIEEYPEAGPFWVGLWAVARHWVTLLEHIFEPEVIAGPGITRSFALRCRKWLWAIEGLLRRLIIAAAQDLDPANLSPARPHAAGQCAPAPSTCIAFAVLPRIPGRRLALAAVHRRKPPAGHRHMFFPGDDLLLLFPRRSRRNAPRAPWRNLNPLHRRGRRNRWDPDYCGEQTSEVPRRERDAAVARARRHRPSPHWFACSSDLPEWKRVELEWERVIPAPRLAWRITALVRVLQAPERWIARTARRLHAQSGLVARLHERPPPRFRKPKLDRGAGPPLEDELALAHARLSPDTS